MEVVTDDAIVHNKTCIGCINHQRDVMITFRPNDDSVFHDMFLTQDQAIQLMYDLNKVIGQNFEIEREAGR